MLRKFGKMRIIAVSVFIVLFISDFALTQWQPFYSLHLVRYNDYEKTIALHGTNKFDKAIFGSSIIISAYIEEQSDAGYVNCGMDWATVSDFYKILKGGWIEVGSELVLVLNSFSFLDTFETEKTYPWHRKWYEPYLYFNRERLANANFNGISESYDKYIYHGILTPYELEDKLKRYHEVYWPQGLENYEVNFRDYERIMDFCESNGIRLRVCLAPLNPYAALPENPAAAMVYAKNKAQTRNIEVLDLQSALPSEFFHDMWHLNYEYGAVRFTHLFTAWLKGNGWNGV